MPNDSFTRKCINHELVGMLMEIGNYERNVNKQMHKYNAYRKAANSIAALDKRIESVEDVKKLVGVGKKIEAKIQEFLSKGEIAKVSEVRKSSVSEVINELMSVSGIGPSAAQKLYDQGIRSVLELVAISDRLTHHQQIGLKYWSELKQPIPRSEMIIMQKLITTEIRKLDRNFKVEVVGSFRRGAETSGDIDILLTHPSLSPNAKKSLLESVVKRLQSIGFLTDTMALGNAKFMGICRLEKFGKSNFIHRRIDIRIFPEDEYFCAIFYFTGSAQFNRHFRAKCLQHGFTLNEYSLRKLGSTNVAGEKLPIHSEKDIFDFVGENFVQPNERN